VTSHRLIQSTLSRLLCVTEIIHDRAHVDDHREGRPTRVQWHSRYGGHSLAWTLEVQQGANGVLAHLTAEACGGPLTRLTPRWQRIALQPLSARRLTRLADLASDWDKGPV